LANHEDGTNLAGILGRARGQVNAWRAN